MMTGVLLMVNNGLKLHNLFARVLSDTDSQKPRNNRIVGFLLHG